ncbi:MAG: oxidoreductase [bacterium]
MSRVALITGASSGIGESAAEELIKAGFVVYAAARRTERMIHLQESGAKIISLDLTVDESIRSCVDTIYNNEGRIDVLVNNAGYGSYGAVEDVCVDEARRQFEVNLFGLARITQLILPTMRRQNGGRIINVASMGGKFHAPYGAWYHSTKFALEGWSDCLRLEVEKPFGIKVVIIEPGAINTSWEGIAMENLKNVSRGGAYETSAASVADAMGRLYSAKNTSPASLIGRTICKASTAKIPKTRYLVGAYAKLLVFARKMLSDRCYDALARKIMKM